MRKFCELFAYLHFFLYLCTENDMKYDLLRHSKWMILFLVWTTGLMILFSAFVADPDDRHGLLLYNALFTVVCPVLFCLTSGRLRQIGLVCFFLVALLPNLIETGWFLMDCSILFREQFWVIFATNPAEASGLLSMASVGQWLLLGLYLLISTGLLVPALREAGSETNYRLSAVGIVGLLSLVLIPGVRYNVPCVNFYNSYRTYRIDLHRAEAFAHMRRDLSGEVKDAFNDSAATVVVVIGESVNRRHCSLYGYCRPTNPRLSQRTDIAVYQDIISPDYMTQTVLQDVLSFANLDDPDARWTSPTIPELLHAAGWKTYWFDPYEGLNNTTKTMPTSFSAIARLCDVYHLSEEAEQYDEAHWTHLEQALQDSAGRKAVFLHLIGNHFPYERRYPEVYRFFGNDDICSPYLERLSDDQKAVINAYDDAVRYNDALLDSLINRLCRQTESCALLYFSDHGEEIYDFDFYAGRSFNHVTRSLYEIPCIFWQNARFAQSNPLKINPSVPYCTDDMNHSLLDLFAVQYAEKDTSRSMFRQGFVPRPRTINGKKY